MRLYEFLLKYRTLVIALGLVTSLGFGLLIHLGVILDRKKPPGPSPAPSPTIRVKRKLKPPVSKQEAAAPPETSRRNPPSPPPRRRPQAIHAVDVRSEPSQTATGKLCL